MAAHAAEPDQVAFVKGAAWSARPLALHGVLAFPGGPLGLIGTELDYSPSRNVGLTAGVGAGWINSTAEWTPRYAIGARYRAPLSERFAVAFGGTFSTGRLAVDDGGIMDEDPQQDVLALDHALWAGVQLSLEWRIGALSIKLQGGVERLLNRGAANCYRTAPNGKGPKEPISCAGFTSSLEPDRVFISPIGTAMGFAF
jgi:hypothetical protein